MSILKVSRMGHPILRRRAGEIPDGQIRRPHLQQLIDDMIETMEDYGGIGLAAPQVFQPLRLVVLGSRAVSGAAEDAPGAIPLTVLLNPRILASAAERVAAWEGCLSIPGIRGVVPRAPWVDLTGLDREGKRLEVRAEGFFARVLQHEIDHLEGMLFLDRMQDLKRLAFVEEQQRHWTESGETRGEQSSASG